MTYAMMPGPGKHLAGTDERGQRAWLLGLPDIPVLPNLNRRTHWSVQAREKAQLREMAAWLAKAAKIPPLEHVTVGMIFTPRLNRTRDPDNLVPVLKALVDGLKDAQVVVDDTAHYVTRVFPRIEPHMKVCPYARVVLTVHQGR